MRKPVGSNSLQLFLKVYCYFAVIMCSVKLVFFMFPGVEEVVVISIVTAIVILTMYFVFWIIKNSVLLAAIAIVATTLALLIPLD